MKLLRVKSKQSEETYYGIRMYHIFKNLDTHDKLRELNISVRSFAKRGYAMASLIDSHKFESVQGKVLFNSIFCKTTHKEIYLLYKSYLDRGFNKKEAYEQMVYESLIMAVKKAKKEFVEQCESYEIDIDIVFGK